MLASHPDIWFPPSTMGSDPVALKFFAQESEWEKGIAHYSYQFRECPSADLICGEKSVAYMDNAEIVSTRILTEFPEMKLLFILRNPVDRAFSHYRYSTNHGLEQCSFTEALVMENYRAKNTPEPLKMARPWAYTWRGRYHQHLEPFFRVFPRGQLHVVFSEELWLDSQRVANDVFEFLGIKFMSIPTAPVVNSFAQRVRSHVTRPASTEMTIYEKHYLYDLFQPTFTPLEDLLQRNVPEIWRQEMP